MELNVVAHASDPQAVRVEVDGHTFGFQNTLHGARSRAIFSAYQARAQLHDADPAAKAPVDLRELQAYVAAADDQQMFGQNVQIHDARIGQVINVGKSIHGGHAGPPADVDEKLLGLQQLAIHPHRMAALKAGVPLDHFKIGCGFQPLRQALHRLLYHRVLTGLNPHHVDRNVALNVHAVSGGGTCHVGDTGAGHQCFGRYATDMHTGAAEQFALNQSRLAPALGQTHCQCRAGLTRTNDDGIERLVHGNLRNKIGTLPFKQSRRQHTPRTTCTVAPCNTILEPFMACY